MSDTPKKPTTNRRGFFAAVSAVLAVVGLGRAAKADAPSPAPSPRKLPRWIGHHD